MPLFIVRKDITQMHVDAIVNTTNREMLGYSGVDLDVHTAAGEELEAECKKLVPLELGFAKITKGYKLDCKYIIHTSGPVWHGGEQGERALLKSCYTESLRLAKEHKCRSVAFPLISSGAYGYPKDKVLRYAVQVISEFLYENEMTVYLCVFDKQSYELSKGLSESLTEFLNDDTDFDDEYAVGAPSFDTPKETSVPFKFLSTCAPSSKPCIGAKSDELSEYIKSMDKGFADTLFDYIDKTGMTDTECYKKANIDRRTFSKIKSNPTYKPSKQTAIAFAIALRLDVEDTQHLLSTAGMTLSRSSVFDKIILFFIQNGVYDVFEINEALFEFDQILLGC